MNMNIMLHYSSFIEICSLFIIVEVSYNFRHFHNKGDMILLVSTFFFLLIRKYNYLSILLRLLCETLARKY